MSQIHLDHNAVTTLILQQVAEQKRLQEVLQQEAMVQLSPQEIMKLKVAIFTKVLQITHVSLSSVAVELLLTEQKSPVMQIKVDQKDVSESQLPD